MALSSDGEDRAPPPAAAMVSTENDASEGGADGAGFASANVVSAPAAAAAGMASNTLALPDGPTTDNGGYTPPNGGGAAAAAPIVSARLNHSRTTSRKRRTPMDLAWYRANKDVAAGRGGPFVAETAHEKRLEKIAEKSRRERGVLKRALAKRDTDYDGYMGILDELPGRNKKKGRKGGGTRSDQKRGRTKKPRRKRGGEKKGGSDAGIDDEEEELVAIGGGKFGVVKKEIRSPSISSHDEDEEEEGDTDADAAEEDSFARLAREVSERNADEAKKEKRKAAKRRRKEAAADTVNFANTDPASDGSFGSDGEGAAGSGAASSLAHRVGTTLSANKKVGNHGVGDRRELFLRIVGKKDDRVLAKDPSEWDVFVGVPAINFHPHLKRYFHSVFIEARGMSKTARNQYSSARIGDFLGRLYGLLLLAHPDGAESKKLRMFTAKSSRCTKLFLATATDRYIYFEQQKFGHQCAPVR